MATSLTSELTRFTDKCNKVLAGGTVKTFEPNSLTPKITYQDPLGVIPNLLEVTLDETGRAKIYLQGDYRIQVYSRDGILIEDNLLVEQTLVQRDFTVLSQEIQTELQQALDQFQLESTAAVDNLYDAITSIGGMVVDGQFKLDWVNVFNKPTTLAGYGITNAYTETEANAAFIENSEKAVASGVATLDANSKVPVVQLPASTETAIGAAEIATQAETDAAADDTRFVTPKKLFAGLRYYLNVTGIAPMFACRAWVNFNGTGTVAIRASGNVSSVTDNGVGLYTVNFTTAMQDVNYSAVANYNDANTAVFDENDGNASCSNYLKTSVKLAVMNGGATARDAVCISVSIIR